MSNPSHFLNNNPPEQWLWVDVSAQRLHVMRKLESVTDYAISTARKGLGELHDSGCTPRGWHVVRARIGAGLPSTAILRGRRWNGDCYPTAATSVALGRQDWILGRILWLSGSESGLNRGGLQDTFRRFIYIHGTADTESLGLPVSAGCVRMCPDAMCTLFADTTPYLPVFLGLQFPEYFPPSRRL